MPDSSNYGEGRIPQATTLAGSARESAALLLVESLIHGLIERSVLSVQEAIEIIDIAADVERQFDETGLAPPFGDFQSLLAPMARSLRVDLNV